MKTEVFGFQGFDQDNRCISMPKIPKNKGKTNLNEITASHNLNENFNNNTNLIYDTYEEPLDSISLFDWSSSSSLQTLILEENDCTNKRKEKNFVEFEDLLKNCFLNSSFNKGNTKFLYIERSLRVMSKIPEDLSIFNQIEKKKKILPPTKFRTTLCVDLDETLIYTDFARKFESHDFVYEGEYGKIGINFRPGLNKFLKYISQHFEVVLFTSGVKEYAEKVLEIIDPKNQYFSSKLFRADCVEVFDYFLIKDLRVLANRSIENIILIDNNLINMYNQPDNGYLISSFYDDRHDSELAKLQSFLETSGDSRIVLELKNKFGFRCKMDCLV